MLIYDELKRDHERMKTLLARIEGTTVRAIKTRTDLLRELKAVFAAHTKAEEAVFYGAILERNPEGEFGRTEAAAHDQALESRDEHQTAEFLLGELEDSDPALETWLHQFKFLKRILEHHFEEEEKELFKKLRKLVSRTEAEELGYAFREMKSDVI